MQNVPKTESALIGLGDDAAVLKLDGPVAVASDLLVEGVHYRPEETSPREIGIKAVNRNFSDIAAMGLAPSWILASAALPSGSSESFIHALVEGMLEAASRFNVSLVGGDTSRSPGGVVIDVTVLARLQGLTPIPRSGAKPGDRILVTGALGGASLGRHLHFTPRIKEGLYLNRFYRPNAMIDISDGLALDLSRILDASQKRS
ncbi:MAG: thiamine-phosphate kinase, partial [Planctomycetes bacterium]|nr:thiamine-phosphate kinase [Planctomycetota bacterium]